MSKSKDPLIDEVLEAFMAFSEQVDPRAAAGLTIAWAMMNVDRTADGISGSVDSTSSDISIALERIGDYVADLR